MPGGTPALLGRYSIRRSADVPRVAKNSASLARPSFIECLPRPLQILAFMFWESPPGSGIETKVAVDILGDKAGIGVGVDCHNSTMDCKEDEVVDVEIQEQISRLQHQNSPFGPLHEASECPHPRRCAEGRYIPDGSFEEKKAWLENQAEKKMTDVEALWWIDRDGRH